MSEMFLGTPETAIHHAHLAGFRLLPRPASFFPCLLRGLFFPFHRVVFVIKKYRSAEFSAGSRWPLV